MDLHDLDATDALDLDLVDDVGIEPGDGDIEPPGATAGEGGRPPSAPADTTPHARWLLTFVLCVFGALELQTILVMFATSEAGGGATSTLLFGGIFLVSVLAWFIGGMLWFAKKFDRH